MSTFRGSRSPARPRKIDPIPSVSHPNERILTFMIEPTDASKQSDERHVKYRRNTNLLTQKNIGGRHTMGNRGMTNWKLTALFAVSLMLIAGLFSNAAIARDGSGTASVTWTPATLTGRATAAQAAVFRGNDVLYEHNTTTGGSPNNPGTAADETPTFRDPLPANSTENQLMFSYRVTTNMAGGQVKFSLPTDWKIITKLENKGATVGAFGRYSDDILVLVSEKYDHDDTSRSTVDASFTLNRAEKKEVGDDGNGVEVPATLLATATADQKLAKRVTIDATSVTIDLNNDWRSGGEVVVVLRNIQTNAPSSLSTWEAGEAAYQSYTVVTKSKKSGRLDLLDPVEVDLDGDGAEDDRAKQPIVRVGNILGNRIDDDS